MPVYTERLSLLPKHDYEDRVAALAAAYSALTVTEVDTQQGEVILLITTQHQIPNKVETDPSAFLGTLVSSLDTRIKTAEASDDRAALQHKKRLIQHLIRLG